MSHYFDFIPTELNEQILIYITDLSDLRNLNQLGVLSLILGNNNFWVTKLYIDFPKLGLDDIRKLYIMWYYFDNTSNIHLNIYNYHRFKVAYQNALISSSFFRSDRAALGFNDISANNLKFLSFIDDKISYYLKYPLMDVEIRRITKENLIEYHISIDLYSTAFMLGTSFNLIENNYDNLFKFIFNAYLASREGV